MNWGDVYSSIQNATYAVNEMFAWILGILQNPDIIQDMLTSFESQAHLTDVIKSIAITLCTLFFMIDFFSKTLHLQWVTWENVMMLTLKLVLAKVCVDNAEWIVMSLYNGFASLTNAIPTSTDLIPTKPLDMIAFYIERTPMPAGSDPNGSDWSPFWWTFNRNDRHDVFDFKPLIYNIKIIIQGFIMQIIMIITSVIVIARYFELTVYTIIAPIPLSTLACEGMTDIGKGFLKSYAAVCIQAIVLIIMFFVYATLKSAIPVNGAIESWGGLIYTFVLAAAVMQSGSWAKKICGAM